MSFWKLSVSFRHLPCDLDVRAISAQLCAWACGGDLRRKRSSASTPTHFTRGPAGRAPHAATELGPSPDFPGRGRRPKSTADTLDSRPQPPPKPQLPTVTLTAHCHIPLAHFTFPTAHCHTPHPPTVTPHCHCHIPITQSHTHTHCTVSHPHHPLSHTPATHSHTYPHLPLSPTKRPRPLCCLWRYIFYFQMLQGGERACLGPHAGLLPSTIELF